MDYQVPQGGELIPLSVRATVDGSAAASEFFAAVQIIAPSGRVMANAVSTAIAAGGSADVTWFPGVSAAAGSTPTSGAWTQVFHYDVPALSAPTLIDTTGSVWDSNTNSIFGLFLGESVNGALHNDPLWLRVNGDTLAHYGMSYEWGDKFISGTPGTFNTGGNVLDSHGTLGVCGATGDSLGTTAFQFWIPKVYQSSQSGKIISTGGYAGLVSAVTGTAVTSYEFSSITRLQLYFNSGSAFAQGSSLTLWAV